MTVNEWVDLALKIGGGVGLPSILLYLVAQRRKARADTALAERTLDSTVAKADTGALEAHMLAVENAFRMERESKDRQIAALHSEVAEVKRVCDERVEELEAENHRKDTVIAGLRAEVATLTERLERLEQNQGGRQ